MTSTINNDVKLLTRYALGYEKEKEYSIAPEQLPQTIAIEKTIRGTVSIFPDLKHPKKYIQNQKAIEQTLKGSNFKETYGNFKNNMEIQRLERRFRPVTAPTAPAGGTVNPKLMREFQKSQHYDKVRQLIDEAKTLKGKDYTKKIKEIYKEIANADLKVHQELTKGSLKPTTKRGKLWNGVKKYTGVNAAKEAGKKALTKSAALRSMSKFARGNAVAAASIDVAISVPEIIQTKEFFDQIDEDGNYIEDQYDENGNLIQKGSGKEKLGNEKALKQTGRVLAVSGTQIAAFAVGAKIGTAAFAAAWAAKGAALGSVAPGVGTVIGGIVGFAVGLGVSYFAGKAAQKVVGKSEIEQFQDKQVEKYSENALKDANVLSDVTQAAATRYQNEVEANGGEDTEETAKIATSFNNVVEAYKNNEIGTPKGKEVQKPATNTSETEQSSATTSSTAKTPTVNTEIQTQESNAASPDTHADADADADTNEDKKAKEKIDMTIKKLDIFIKFLSSLNSPCTSSYNGTMNYNPYTMGMGTGFMSFA